jgi:hypothetical protein
MEKLSTEIANQEEEKTNQQDLSLSTQHLVSFPSNLSSNEANLPIITEAIAVPNLDLQQFGHKKKHKKRYKTSKSSGGKAPIHTVDKRREERKKRKLNNPSEYNELEDEYSDLLKEHKED